jgi:hypothetical protein
MLQLSWRVQTQFGMPVEIFLPSSKPLKNFSACQKPALNLVTTFSYCQKTALGLIKDVLAMPKPCFETLSRVFRHIKNQYWTQVETFAVSQNTALSPVKTSHNVKTSSKHMYQFLLHLKTNL